MLATQKTPHTSRFLFGNRKIDADGFTLLEVMVAIAILAIALTTLLGSQGQSMFVADELNFTSTSSFLARQKMSEILAAEAEPFNSDGDFGNAYAGYYWESEISNVDFGESEALYGSESVLKRLDVTVHTEGKRQTFTITRYMLTGVNW